ncbi:hypothetical protein [Pantoea sp. 18069]|uniref:hypothetical protein n=1 Tax=Pantoea sp. 18069 TaxID=2681415 RepID=UPI001356748B|nr:hypothetical protein [Pantoea sp. 18069]
MTFPTIAVTARISWGLLLLAAIAAPAAAAPGEDPLVLTTPVEHLSMPWAPAAPSKGLETEDGIPSAIQAKVARYLAKSMSANAEGIQTDADAITTNATQGLRRSCTQEIASNTDAAAGRYGPNTSPAQIVVLRGDLINACR